MSISLRLILNLKEICIEHLNAFTTFLPAYPDRCNLFGYSEMASQASDALGIHYRCWLRSWNLEITV